MQMVSWVNVRFTPKADIDCGLLFRSCLLGRVRPREALLVTPGDRIMGARGERHRSKWAYSILIARERESGRARLSHYHRPAAGLRPSSHRKHAVFQSCTPSLSLAGNPHADQRPAERFLAL